MRCRDHGRLVGHCRERPANGVFQCQPGALTPCPLLRDGAIYFDGRYYKARECELPSRGPRPGGPPLMVGTRGPRMLWITARHADLWNGAWPAVPSAPRR